MRKTDANDLDSLQLAPMNETLDPIPAVTLAQGVDPNQVDADGMQPRHLAAIHGADPQMRTPDGVLPIQLLKADQQMDPETYQAIRETLRSGGGGTHLIRELYLASWTPWIIAGFSVLLALGNILWRMIRPMRII